MQEPLDTGINYLNYDEVLIGENHPLGYTDTSNRPVKELSAKFDNGLADIQVPRTHIKITSEQLGTVTNDDIVYLNTTTKLFEKAFDSDAIGIIDVDNLMIYTFGVCYFQNATLTPGEKYYLDNSTPGAITTNSASKILLGYSLSTDTIFNLVSVKGGNLQVEDYDANKNGIIDRAETADILTTTRNIKLSGDVAGNADFNGSQDIDMDITIQPNSVALGTDTTGNYVENISGTTNQVNATANGESSNITLSLPQDIHTGANPTFAGINADNINIGITDSNTIDTDSGDLKLDSATNETLINTNLTVSGDLVVNGTTTTVNSDTVNIEDPVLTLGGNDALTVNDSKDRGVEFKWHNGSSEKTGYFGYDNSTGKFTFIPDATNSSEIFSGTKGTLDAHLEWTDLLNLPDPTITLTGDVTGSGTLTNLGSVSFAATVGNDTHSHTTSTITDFTEDVQDVVGGMVSSNTESGIAVTYDDTSGKLNFNVADPTITLTGDVTGSGTLTNLGNLSFSTTIQPNSVSLGTDTTGNYVATAAGGTGINVTNGSGEGTSASIAIDSTVATLSGTQTLTNKKLVDSSTSFIDEADNSKVAKFQLSPISTATTRTFSLPNVNGTLITTGDTGTVTGTMIANNTITNTDISTSAAIADTKLATISTAGKVSNSATTAISTATANAIVTRDASGNFSANIITASLNGNASTATKLATARDITLSGELSGTGSFDGNGNTSISSTVASNVIDADNLKVTGNGTTSQFLRSDGDGTFSWATPTGTNTATGTVTSIATSGAITGGTITTSGTISHSTADGYKHVPATSTTNNGKVLTAGATAGSFSWETPASTYSHPTYAGDDINLDTTALSGATVISDLDFNVTTDTLGHVTDANASYATRSLTAANIGAVPISGGTMTGQLILDNQLKPLVLGGASDIGEIGIDFKGHSTQIGSFTADHTDTTSDGGNYSFHFSSTEAITNVILDSANASSNFKVNSYEVWHEGNDGSGSGLDADTVDGIHASGLARMTISTYDQLLPSQGTWLRAPSSGFLPSANGAGALGTSSWKFGSAYINTMYGNVSGNVSGNVTGSSGSCTGNAATATWADTVDVNSANTSATWYDVVWHSGDSVYSSTGVEIQGSTNSLRATNLYATDMYVDDQIFSTGDTDTYMQFHAANQWRVVTGGTEMLEVNDTNVIVQSDLTVNGGDIILGGTGRIQGIDTVSLNTDAANKLYVDNAVAGGGAGAVGGGSDEIFYENDQTVTTSYTISTGKNAMTAGPVTVNTGITVTIPTGSAWVIS